MFLYESQISDERLQDHWSFGLPWNQSPGFLPRDVSRGINGSTNIAFICMFFSSYQEQQLIRNHLYLDHWYIRELNYILWHLTPANATHLGQRCVLINALMKLGQESMQRHRGSRQFSQGGGGNFGPDGSSFRLGWVRQSFNSGPPS